MLGRTRTAADDGAARRARPRWRLRVLAILTALVVVVLAWGLVEARSARSDLERSRELVASLRDTPTAGRADVVRIVDEAHEAARSARRHTDRPGPALAARLPVIGRSFAAVRNVATAGESVLGAADQLLGEVGGKQVIREGGLDVAVLRRLSATLAELSARTAGPVRQLQRTRTGLTPPIVSRSVGEAQDDLGGTPDGLNNTSGLLAALAGVAGDSGERQLLIVLENNAELRGTGGLISVFAVATTRHGRFELGPFRDVERVSEPASVARRVPAPSDYTAIYGPYLANSTLWKNTNMSPSGPDSLSVMAGVARASLRTRPSAVLALDVPAIAAILRATGPVDLPGGRQVSADNVLKELLVEAYENVPDTNAGQDERRRRLRVTADAIIRRLLRGGDVVAMARGLAAATAGRHVMLWSGVPSEQAAFMAAGAAGNVRDDGSDLVNVTVQNFGSGDGEGNKLDYYADRTVRVSVEMDADRAETTQVVTIANRAPKSGLPRYVAGVKNPGQTNNFVTFAVPQGAELLTFERDGAAQATRFLPEGAHTVLLAGATIDAGEQTSWTLRYRTTVAKGEDYLLWLVPQPLARPATLSVDVRAAGREDRAVGVPAGPWNSVVKVVVGRDEPGWWGRTRKRIKSFWEEPVRIG